MQDKHINDELFEKNLDLINQEIAKRKSRWNLKILAWMDFEDVSQIIRLHIYKKIHLYNLNQPILPWVNRIISNQMKNMIRDNYGNFSRPCLKCESMQGQEGCAIYDKQCGECPLYRKWEKTKKRAHDAKLPVSIESHLYEIGQKSDDSLNVEDCFRKISDQVEQFLKPIEYQVFVGLYINNHSEEKMAKLLGYVVKDKILGVKNVKLINKNLIKKIKLSIYNGSIDIY